MKLKTLLCLVAFFLTTIVQAQELKIIVNKKGLVGYADNTGNEIIKCQFETAMPFSNGIAIVTKSGKSGIIDTAGKILLPIKYEQISLWNKNLYLIKSGKKLGLANNKGEIVLDVKYSHISKLNCYGKALITLGGKETVDDKKTYMANAKYGIIDSSGNILVSAQYKGLYEFSFECKDKYPYYEGKRLEYSYHYTNDTLQTDCRYLGFSKNGLSIYNAGIIDGNGKELLEQGLYYFVMQPQNGMVRYYIAKRKTTLCGYHNLNTGTSFQVAKFDSNINNINFWSHGDFMGDIAPVNGETWSFIDKSGKILRTGYSALKHSPFLKLWAAQNSSSTYDVFNEQNEDIPELSGFTKIEFPANAEDKEIFSVMKEDKYGCVTRQGEVVVPFEYEFILKNEYNTLGVKKDGKWGLLSAENKIIIPTEYIDLILPSEYDTEDFWVKKQDSLFYHLHPKTGKLSSIGYKSVTNFVDGIAHVTPTTMTVNDTPVNRAQIFKPNATKTEIDGLELSKYTESFGLLLNTEDVLIFDKPVSKLYKKMVLEELKKHGNKTLTDSKKMNILLNVTKENRSYNLKSTLSEEEWDY